MQWLLLIPLNRWKNTGVNNVCDRFPFYSGRIVLFPSESPCSLSASFEATALPTIPPLYTSGFVAHLFADNHSAVDSIYSFKLWSRWCLIMVCGNLLFLLLFQRYNLCNLWPFLYNSSLTHWLNWWVTFDAFKSHLGWTLHLERKDSVKQGGCTCIAQFIQ